MLQISSELKESYMQILAHCKDRRAECFTQKEIAAILGISLRKYIDFENGKNIDFILLDQICGLTGFELNLNIRL